MVRNVRDTLRMASRETQENGITRLETIQLFLRNGYGDRRAIRRTNEAIIGGQLQPIADKVSPTGETLYTCVWWPYARHPSDFNKVIATVTDRQGFTYRIDDPRYVEKVLNTMDMYNL